MDSIAPATFDILAAIAQPSAIQPSAIATTAANAAPTVFDLANFDAAYASAAHSPAAAARSAQVSASESAGFRSVMVMLQGLNGHAGSISAVALQNKMSDGTMTPGDMLAMTTQAYEFLFHCELTANVANRTTEGVQQLFQQQS